MKLRIEAIGSFVAELRRRHVIKIGGFYLAFLIGVLAFANDLEDLFSVPAGTGKTMVVLALLGFPFAVIVAWAFELTPEGVKRTRDLDAAAYPIDVPPKPDSELASIAVLPFTSASVSGHGAFLAKAIPLELNSTLANVQRLRVVSGQSAFARSQEGKDMKTIARELGVNYVVSGSVSQYDDEVRVIAELYDAINDTLLWTERFDRQQDRPFETERRIAEAVAMAFGGERLRLEVEQARQRQTTDQAAWELVQKARSYLLNYTPDSVDAAIPMLEKAVELDPDYATGHAQLALVTAEKTLNAIGDDPDGDRDAALAAIARAEGLAPNDPVVLRSAGVVHAYCGNNAESIRLLRRATSLAPYDLGAWGYLGWPMVGTGQSAHLAELHEILDRLLSVGARHPGKPYWLYHKSVAVCCEGHCERALEYIENALAEQPRFAIGWMHDANVNGLIGNDAGASAAVERSLGINPRFTSDYYAGLIGRLSDSAAVAEHRTGGLRNAGLIGESR